MSVLPSRNDRSVQEFERRGVDVRTLRSHDLTRGASEAANPLELQGQSISRTANSHFRREVADSEREYRRILAKRFLAADRFTRAVGQAIWLRL